MWRHVQTYAVVTIVTLLIWMLAESEGVRTATLRINVDLSPESSGRVLEVLTPAFANSNAVLITMSGPVARIDTLNRELRGTLHLAAGVPNEPGEHRVDLRAVLSAYPAIRDSGVTITDADPPAVNVYVDDLVSREAAVIVRVPDGALATAPTPTPAKATLRFPSRLASRLAAAPEVYAAVPQASIDSLPDSRFATVPGITLTPPESLRNQPGSQFVSVDPPTVSVGLTPASSDAARVLPTVPVQLLIPPIEFDKWVITLEPTDLAIQNATVTGPADLVQQVVDKKILVVAVVQLTFGELENAARTGQPLVKEAVFSLLPGPLRIDAADRSISMTVKARE